MTIQEMFTTEEFRKALQANIDNYNNRPAPEEGRKYVRTPYDTLKENGQFTLEALPALYAEIVMKQSKLPSSQREAITAIVNNALFATHQALQEKELPDDVREKRQKAAAERAAKQIAAKLAPKSSVVVEQPARGHGKRKKLADAQEQDKK